MGKLDRHRIYISFPSLDKIEMGEVFGKYYKIQP